MNDRDFAIAVLLLPSLIIVGGVVVMIAGIRLAGRSAELQHQERMAMIERGLTPGDGADGPRRAYGFKMSLGILLCGLGLGLLMLITFAAGDVATGFGVGGAIVMVGLAFIVSAMFTERQGPALEGRTAARPGGSPGGTAVPALGARAAEPMVKRRDFDEGVSPPPVD
jgi:hypothetical protein